METKKCSSCKQEYPASLEYFYVSSYSKDKLLCRCKTCCAKYNKDYFQRHRVASNKRKQKYKNKLKNRKDNEILIPKNKYCCGCNKIRMAEEFSKSRRNKDGLRDICKECRSRRDKQVYRELKDEIAQGSKRGFYVIKNKSKKCFGCGKIKSSSEFFRHKLRRGGLSTRCKECNKIYRIESRKKINNTIRIRYKNRIKEDLGFKILLVLRSRIRKAVKSQNTIKSKSTEDLIGCSISFFWNI